MVKVILVTGSERKADLFPEHMTLRKALVELAPEYICGINAVNGRPRLAESLDQPLRELAENDIVCIGTLRNIMLDMGDGVEGSCIPVTGEPLLFSDVGETTCDSEPPF